MSRTNLATFVQAIPPFHRIMGGEESATFIEEFLVEIRTFRVSVENASRGISRKTSIGVEGGGGSSTKG
jgi:hypothetical protein